MVQKLIPFTQNTLQVGADQKEVSKINGVAMFGLRLQRVRDLIKERMMLNDDGHHHHPHHHHHKSGREGKA